MTVLAHVGRAAGAASVAGLAAASLAGALVVLFGPDAWSPARVAAGLAVAALAWWRPVAAAACLLAIAPILGNRPTTPQFQWLVWLTAAAVPVWLVRLLSRERAAAASVLTSPLGLAMLAYAAVSVLSLSSLPWYAPRDLLDGVGVDGAWALARAILAADVGATIYPVLTVIVTLHAAVAALVIATGIRSGGAAPADADADPTPDVVPDLRRGARLVTTALAAGLMAAVCAGFLERAGYLDLRGLRAFDPFTNLTGAQRLQSTFGHAGWFAEYICFATPALLVLFFWPADPAARLHRSTRLSRLGALAAMLAAALAAIVLSYQRGGWLTWIVVGVGVATAALRLTVVEGQRRVAWGGARFLTAIALSVVVALGLGVAVMRIAGGAGAAERFAARARSLTQVSDRQVHVTAGLRLGALLPVLGGGSESFALRYREEYLLAGGEYYARGHDPLVGMYGSAHNVFAQTFAGKGAAGLLALLAMLAAAGRVAWQTLRSSRAGSDRRVVSAIVLGMLVAFAIYGQVQEVFYVPALQLTVFAAFGLAAGLATGPARPGRLGPLAGLLAVVLGAHLVQAYVVPGRLADDYRDHAISAAGARLSAPERGDDGEYFQWTGPTAVVSVSRQATVLSFELRNPAPEPRTVEVRFDGRVVDQVRLGDGEWRRVSYPMRRVRTALPRRLELAVAAPAGGAAAIGRGVAVRRLRWTE
jgi:hypothetical protein